MSTRAYTAGSRQNRSDGTENRVSRVIPIARFVALTLAAGGALTDAHAQQAFSPAWFAAKGAGQAAAVVTGTLPSGQPANALSAPNLQSKASQQKLAQSIINLNAAAQAIALQQALQQQARQTALAAASGVPNGLGAGGLQVDNNDASKGWSNANAPTQTTSGGQTTVTIEQTANNAVLSWETFNVGSHTTVDFQQQADWAVLNRVNDPSARPSQIEGQIKADGTVLILNRNGVLFSGGSQVNVRNLVAAAATMTDDQFTGNGLYGAGADTASFTDAGGTVTVARGAQISTIAPQSVTDGGGYVLLLGAEVDNAGTITTPRGQTGLAAGDSFLIRKGVATDANQYSTTRGNEIAPQLAAAGTSATVSNTGLITAEQGDITLAGHAVKQDGVAISTTTVNQRGTIHLLNSASDTTGTVVLGGNAVTAVLIQDDGSTAYDNQRATLIQDSATQDQARLAAAAGPFDDLSKLADRRDESRIEIVSGHDAVFDAGSLSLATGGQISVSAVHRSFVADGAQLDVSGAVGVQVSMGSNNVLVNVQGNELRDDPVNRDSARLFNSNIWVDERGLIHVPAGTGGYEDDRYYTGGGLLEVGGYLGTQGHSIGEWAAQGGTITLSGGEAVTQTGSKLNLSGGSLDVATGYIHETWLLGADGRVYLADQAPAGILYTGVYTGYQEGHTRWGVTDSNYSPLVAPQGRLENGYTVGRDAGTLVVATPAAVLEGQILSDTYQGGRQSQAANPAFDGYAQSQLAQARGGQLIVGSYQTAFNSNAKIGVVGPHGNVNAVADQIVFDAQYALQSQALTVDDPLPDDLQGTIHIDSHTLSSIGLGGLTAAARKGIAVDGALGVQAGGAIALYAPTINVDADLVARSGRITLSDSINTMADSGVIVPTRLVAPPGQDAGVVIGGGATLDTRGLWTNLQQAPEDAAGLAWIGGGDVIVQSNGAVDLRRGTAIDVSSGGAVRSDGSIVGGQGGNVTLSAGHDVAAPTNNAPDDTAPLILDGTLRAYGVNGGGTLTIESGRAIGIGADLLTQNGTLQAGGTTTVNLQLSDDYVVPAGAPLPFDFTITVSSLKPGQTLTTATQPHVISTAPLTVAADWVVPAGVSYVQAAGYVSYFPGATVPAGTVLWGIVGALPVGYTIPGDAFPQGIPITPVKTLYTQGQLTSSALTIPAGTTVPAGSSFAGDVAVKPVLRLDTSLFQSGFAGYVIVGRDGVTVADGTRIDVQMPVLLPDVAVARATPTGADTAEALKVWMPPLYQEDPAHAVLTQRDGASLTLSSGSEFRLDNAPLTIGKGAVVTVDPGQSINLHADGQLTVDGRLNAWGGRITLASMPEAANGERLSRSRSVWIGDDAVLDAAGRARIAHDSQGRPYGVAQDGGSITVSPSDAFVLIRPGAVLDASGAAAAVDLSAGGPPGTAPQLRSLAGAGGSISLSSSNGIYLDGTLRARAGGAGASGGSLTLVMQERGYSTALGEVLGDDLNVLHNITLVQDAAPGDLPADLAAGRPDPALVFGHATLGVNQIEAGGFDALTLQTHDLFVVDGDVTLSLGRSLNLKGGILSLSTDTPGARVTLAAPYVRFDGGSWAPPFTDATSFAPGFYAGTVGVGGLTPAAGSSLSVSADLVDVYGDVVLGGYALQGSGTLPSGAVARTFVSAPGFAEVSLTSSGDVRLAGVFTSAGDVTVTAAQIYPMSGSNGAIVAGAHTTAPVPGAAPTQQGIDPDSVLAIRSSTGVTPDVPYSVFGNLVLFAGTVDQGGVVRAPLGTISLDTIGGNSLGTLWNGLGVFDNQLTNPEVILRAGSLTSVSAAGLTMPFGGTSDGVTYQAGAITTGAGYTGDGLHYNLADTYVFRGSDGGTDQKDQYVLAAGISIGAAHLVGEAGSVLDLSGGGTLQGEGFVSGRGGSVNVLTTPLASSNPSYTYSHAGDAVYAVMPGYASGYAPVIADKGAGDPLVGRQITLAAGMGGLPAGTYTLLPASFALMPGAYRVEIGSALTGMPPAAGTAVPGGSWVGAGTLSIAGTGIHDSLPRQIVLTAGATLRTLSQYNETTYSQFVLGQGALYGDVRERLPEDGKMLNLVLRPGDGASTPLEFDGTVSFSGASTPELHGIDGAMIVTAGASIIEVRPAAAAATPGMVSLIDSDLNAFAAPTLLIGGAWTYFDGLSTLGDSARLYFGFDGKAHNGVTIAVGATLKAGQIFLVGNAITVGDDATLDTRGFIGNELDSSLGYVYANSLIAGTSQNDFSSPAVLAVGNGRLDFLGAEGQGTISVGDHTSLLTEGTIAFSAPGNLDLGAVTMGARYLTVAQNQINVGTADSLAAARAAGVLPDGWDLTQDVLDQLLTPAAGSGLPALERLSLTAGGAFNFFGSVTLDSSSSDARLVFNTPAFYGWGDGADTVHLVSNAFVWNGVATGTGTATSPYGSAAPAPVLPGGAGTGSGTLRIDAHTVELGYDALSRAQSQGTLDRLALGFSAVDINATEAVTANSAGSLTVAGTQAADGSRSGGDLTIRTPVLTGAAGSRMSYVAGGQLSVQAPDGAQAPDTAADTDLGATVSLQGRGIWLDTTVALPSGALSLHAASDIGLGDQAQIDLSGRTIAFFDVSKNTWGGTATLASDNGDVTLAAGSRIDVSAAHGDAGSLSISAAAGDVTLGGTLAGGGGGGEDRDGRFALTTRRMDDAGFGALNQQLTASRFMQARDFTIESGDLTVADGVQAHEVSITTNGGSLGVQGRIDASGGHVGSITLSARDDLTLAAGSDLDAHGDTLVVDSYGQAVDASNRASVSLTSAQGRVSLAPGATLDLGVTHGDGVARGEVAINAPRAGDDDIAIDAGGTLSISGAASIAVNGFRRYEPSEPSIDQAYLDTIDADSRRFINGAWDNAALQTRLAGLSAYGPAYHLRPGVEIDSDGDLSTVGDLDLSGHRYGPDADPAVRGSGEPGVLVLRAGGDLRINGSINDGFAPPPSTPDDAVYATVLSQVTLTSVYTVSGNGLTLSAGTSIPTSGTTLDFALPVKTGTAMTLSDSKPLPIDVTLGGYSYSNRLKAHVVIAADMVLPDGTIFPAGTSTDVIYAYLGRDPNASNPTANLPAGTTLRAGMNNIAAITGFYGMQSGEITVPAGTDLSFLGTSYSLSGTLALSGGAVLPVGTYVSSGITHAGDREIWAIAPMLVAGSQSWSLRLVGGADLGSADSRAVQSVAGLSAAGRPGDIVLNDPFQVNAVTSGGYGNVGLGISVVRTGTGSLELYAGGGYEQDSPYGVYTAGTAIAGTGPGTPWNAPRATSDGQTVFGAGYPSFEDTLNAQRMWYTTGGGDFTLAVQGDIVGSEETFTEQVSTWLWRQGPGDGHPAAWGVNFGSYVYDGYDYDHSIGLAAFSGMGTLGGGNVRVSAGGDIGRDGDISSVSVGEVPTDGRLNDIAVVVGGSGRVIDGALTQSGGGSLTVTAGAALYGGFYANLRGDIAVDATRVGVVDLQDYGTAVSGDPRGVDSATPYAAASRAGVRLSPGDGAVTVRSLGDLVMNGVQDPGRAYAREFAGVTDASGNAAVADTWFTLWTPDTRIDLFSAGGNVSPMGGGNEAGGQTGILPSVLRVVAAGGSIYYAGAGQPGDYLMPSPTGALELLASGLITGASANNPSNAGGGIGLLGSPLDAIATPLHPAWGVFDVNRSMEASNYWRPGAVGYDPVSYENIYDWYFSSYSPGYYGGGGGTMLMFAPSTLSDASAAGGGVGAHIYAVKGDVLNVLLGDAQAVGSSYDGTATTYYYASKPAFIEAGGDIVNSGGLMAHYSPTDVSLIAAGRDIFYSDFSIAGPGTLEVSAGGNIYQGNKASLVSVGPVMEGDTRAGADIVVQAGLGGGLPGIGQTNWAGFAQAYLDPANQASQNLTLGDQPGKVVHTYQDELASWLAARYGHSAGGPADALAYFNALAPEQQRIFLREVYYDELVASGREYTGAVDSRRLGSYLRGRDVIGVLFPRADADGNDIVRAGDLTLFQGTAGNAGIRTVGGGTIQTLTPGGETLVGVEGVTPTSTSGKPAGVITQGGGDIEMYAQDSVLLGLSRIMTTFGGDIVIWSATGDINAGRGAKTTLVYTPPREVYDAIGNLTLSPQVPGTGAGIATLAPIPEVPPGDVDLIAPLGTIDAGEAGIRVSGSVNLAALRIVNAANIQVQGEAHGLPVVARVNVGALSSAGAAASAAVDAAQDMVKRQTKKARSSVIQVEVLGFGDSTTDARDPATQVPVAGGPADDVPYDPTKMLQVVGLGNRIDSRYWGRLTEEERSRLQQDR